MVLYILTHLVLPLAVALLLGWLLLMQSRDRGKTRSYASRELLSDVRGEEMRRRLQAERNRGAPQDETPLPLSEET